MGLPCLIALAATTCWSEVPTAEPKRLLYVDCGPREPYEVLRAKGTELPGVFAKEPAGEAGRPLSSNAVRLFEDLRSGGLSHYWLVMPLGKTDQAVAFPANDRIASTSGAITFLYQGPAWHYTATEDKNKNIPRRTALRAWDTGTAARETFFELRGPDAVVSFG